MYQYNIAFNEENSEIKITKSKPVNVNLLGRKRIKTPGHLSRCLRSENKAASDYLRLSFYSLDPTAPMLHARKNLPTYRKSQSSLNPDDTSNKSARAKISMIPVTLNGYSKEPDKGPRDLGLIKL